MTGHSFLLGYAAYSLKSGVLYEASLQYLICIVRIHDSSTLPHAQRNKELLFLLESVLDSALKMKYSSEKTSSPKLWAGIWLLKLSTQPWMNLQDICIYISVRIYNSPSVGWIKHSLVYPYTMYHGYQKALGCRHTKSCTMAQKHWAADKVMYHGYQKCQVIDTQRGFSALVISQGLSGWIWHICNKPWSFMIWNEGVFCCSDIL